MSDGPAEKHAYTIRLELVDRPGELLSALEPIAAHDGNLVSIFHERDNVTPRGQLPVEVAIEATPAQFEQIAATLQDSDVTVVQAGTQRYTEEVTVLLVGHLVETDLSNTLSRIEETTGASVRDFALAAPEGTDAQSSARVRLATETGETERAVARLRDVAADKDLRVIEPLTGGDRS